jgi:CheY-like chemotaxis protein
MHAEVQPIRLLMAEDDKEDQLLVRKAFEASHLANEMDIVENGEELLDYLNKRGPYAGKRLPDLILLDLNMPRKDGREALEEIKSDSRFHQIPIVVLTTSSADEDIVRSYDLGVNSYIEKPVTFGKLVEVIRALGQYWFNIVRLPHNSD